MTETTEQRTRQLIADMWRRHQGQVMERVTLLEATAAAASAHTLTAAQSEEAISIAHKLAGSLGMFGFTEGTRIARATEHELEKDQPDGRRLESLASELRRSLLA